MVADPFDNLNVLLEAVFAADPAVLDLLSNPDADVTVFAPEDSAFQAVPPELLGPIVEDPALITAVLQYHVLPRRVDPRRVFYIREKKTALPAQTVFISRGGSNPNVNQSEIQCRGVKTTNGLVWLIDSVLLPQF